MNREWCLPSSDGAPVGLNVNGQDVALRFLDPLTLGIFINARVDIRLVMRILSFSLQGSHPIYSYGPPTAS